MIGYNFVFMGGITQWEAINASSEDFRGYDYKLEEMRQTTLRF